MVAKRAPWEEIEQAFGDPWKGAGAAHLRSTQERGVPFLNMQAQPKFGTGKPPAKSAGELLERSGQSHVVGSGLATGRVGYRLRAQMAGEDPVRPSGKPLVLDPEKTAAKGTESVRPSIRSKILASDPTTARGHDLDVGRRMIVHPEVIEDAEVRQAGLPPLRATSRAGYMPGLGSIARHQGEVRAMQPGHEALQNEMGALKRQAGNAQRRQRAAAKRGDVTAAQSHEKTAKELQRNMRSKSKEVAGVEKEIGKRRSRISQIAGHKQHAHDIVAKQSDLDLSGEPSYGAALQKSHKAHFDPTVKEEFYPVASQYQTAEVAQRSGRTQTEAINVTGMTSAQRQWRKRNTKTGEVTHPNMQVAEAFGSHTSEMQRQGVTDPAEISQRFQTPKGLMGLAKSHGRQAARILTAEQPEQVADVWAETGADKRPTFTLGLAAGHPNQSVRRQSVQAATIDTHASKEAGVDYSKVLGTTNINAEDPAKRTMSGLSVTSAGEVPHQTAASVQPAYSMLAMHRQRAAFSMTAKELEARRQAQSAGTEREQGPIVSPRYGQENPWGLFAAENMQDVARARAVKKAGGSRVIRQRAGDYYREQAGDMSLRTMGNKNLSGGQF